MNSNNTTCPQFEEYRENLSQAIRAGDENAFARYYMASIERLVVLVARIIKDSEEARNIVQDTFIKLWLQREQIDSEQSLDAFVSRIAWNAALDFLRHKQTLEKFHDEQLHTQSTEETSGEDRFIATETARRIEQIVVNMPAMRRKVFELSRMEHLTYNQIAERLHISYNTVLFHMKEALKDVRVVMSILAFIALMYNVNTK
jgi:RNA polymerase sigma-70 factor (ECF subfamily)